MVNKNCCSNSKKQKEDKGFLAGLMYGLLPHTGCIAFIIFSILGITTATAFFKPLLMSRFFFYGLILMSIGFATLSAAIYLRKNGMLSVDGIKKKKGYLSILYGSSIAINLLLFLVIFPIAANVSAFPTGSVVGGSDMRLKVDIPCPGHAPLITEELKTIQGVQSVKFAFPNNFDVIYDSSTDQNEILGLAVFDTYSATKVSGGELEQAAEKNTAAVPSGCGSCGGCSGACGGSCGG